MENGSYWLALLREQEVRFWGELVYEKPPAGSLVRTRCWRWTRAVDKDGYGKFAITNTGKRRPAQKFVRAHQAAYALAKGKWPTEGMVVMHLCNNPSCCNPSHLKLGTVSENKIHHDRTVRTRR